MAVNVDSVYQTVQALANKEQRGYLTPQEFNLLANQAQASIFERYFYDINAFRKQNPQEREIGDSVTHIEHKLKNTDGVSYDNAGLPSYGGNGIWNLPTTAGVLTGRIFYQDSSGRRELRVTSPEEIYNLRGSAWHGGSDEAFFWEDGVGRIQVHKISGPVATGVTCERVNGRPGVVYWSYVIVNEKPVYDSTHSHHFSLHASEQPDLVINILKLAGISIEDLDLYQVGSQEEQKNIQQENK